MAKFEKDYASGIAAISDYVDAIVKECLGTYDSLLETSVIEIGGITTKIWTGTCVYFGGRVVSLSVILAGNEESSHLTVHSTPGVGAVSIDTKVIRKFTEKLTRIDRN